MDCNIKDSLIQKQTLHAGSKFVELVPGTKVKFHYEVKRADNQKVIDDSRKINKPLELVLGKKFKLEVLEVIVQKMALNEVAKFTVDKSVRDFFLRKTKQTPGIVPSFVLFVARNTISIRVKDYT